MKSAEEIMRAHSSVCPKFPDPTCGDGCMCNADLAAIRAAQIDAAAWMREEVIDALFNQCYGLTCEEIASVIRSIKLPGDGE